MPLPGFPAKQIMLIGENPSTLIDTAPAQLLRMRPSKASHMGGFVGLEKRTEVLLMAQMGMSHEIHALALNEIAVQHRNIHRHRASVTGTSATQGWDFG